MTTEPQITDEITIEWESDRIRICPWRGDGGKALLIPAPGRVPSTEAVLRCLEVARDRGYLSALTSALSLREQEPFRACSFEMCRGLHLLEHDLRSLPDSPGDRHRRAIRLRRARRRDTTTVLSVDARAFDPFWRFDLFSLEEARRATSSSRWRVADDGGVVGYAITGRSGHNAYLQRLAVDPEAQGRGIGHAMVLDSLRWARRHHVRSMLVNTQESNERALRLYEHLGFVIKPEGLAVLQIDLDMDERR